MKRRLLHMIAWLVALASPVVAQDWPSGEPVFDGGWSVSASTAYFTGAGSPYPGARVGVAYSGRSLHLGVVSRVNEQLNFRFAPGDLIVYVDDPDVAFREGTRLESRPDYYSMGVPAEAVAVVRVGATDLVGRLSLFMQETRLEAPSAHRTEDGLYVISWRPERFRRIGLAGGGVARFRMNRAVISAGVLGVPVARLGDDRFRYAFRPGVAPYLATSVRAGAGSFDAGAAGSHAAVGYRHSFASPWVSGSDGASGRIAYQAGIGDFPYHMVDVRLDVPLSRGVRATAGLSQSWSRRYPFRSADFSAWQAAFIPGASSEITSGLPHTSIRLGITVVVGSRRAHSPVEIWSVDLADDRIFTAARTRYATDPVGSVRLHNASPKALSATVTASTTESGARYRSEPVLLDPGDERRIPLFLYAAPVEETVHEQLEVAVETAGSEPIVSSVAIVTYGRNAWDGDTRSLRHFLTPEDPEVRRHARDLYVRASEGVGADITPARQFKRLQGFLDALGRDVAFVEDPTSTMEVDHVQYPIETLRDGRGDCEDLTVYLASALMAVGIGAAIVDVRPGDTSMLTGSRTSARPDIGHVFLLVDTGIRPAEMEALELNEFQTLTRAGAGGIPTLWIPIETTALERGFEAAFNEGVREYAALAFGTTRATDRAFLVVDL